MYYSIVYLHLFYLVSCGKITVEEIKNCDDFNSDTNALQLRDFKVVTKNDKVVCTGDIIFKDNIGDQYYANTDIFASMGGKRYVKIMTQKENDPCIGLKKNLGVVWEDIQKSAKMPVGQCPLKKGTYHLNTVLDLSKIPFPIPPGSLKLLLNGYLKNGKKRAYCCEIKIKSE